MFAVLLILAVAELCFVFLGPLVAAIFFVDCWCRLVSSCMLGDYSSIVGSFLSTSSQSYDRTGG